MSTHRDVGAAHRNKVRPESAQRHLAHVGHHLEWVVLYFTLGLTNNMGDRRNQHTRIRYMVIVINCICKICVGWILHYMDISMHFHCKPFIRK